MHQNVLMLKGAGKQELTAGDNSYGKRLYIVSELA
jgi:hypothetical protein